MIRKPASDEFLNLPNVLPESAHCDVALVFRISGLQIFIGIHGNGSGAAEMTQVKYEILQIVRFKFSSNRILEPAQALGLAKRIGNGERTILLSDC